ncbi:MAG: type II toxin-antitoxin system ParD family antitoxin [Pyrinomonadaceae bacterium]
MNVSLTPELEKYVNDKVKTGRYNSASEVVRESLRTLQDHDELQRIRRDELRREIMLGVDSIRNGEGITVKASELEDFAENIIRRGMERTKARTEKR